MFSRHRERHRTEHIGWLRAAVMGANDGIVSTASLVLGVAAADGTHSNVLVAGVAGLVAGAMSMAAGEYVSVHSQADTERADLEQERAELTADNEAERNELTAIYEGRSLDPSLAKQVAAQLMAHDALGAHARDELGISEPLRARPVQAALASAASFAGGAAMPLLVGAVVPAASLILIVAGTSLVFLACGMGAVAVGNVIGAGAPDEFVLLAARIIEGVGFFGVVLAIPSMLAQLVRRNARDTVMAVRSAYMPAGIMLMLFAGPLLPTIGWRKFWFANALLASACTVLLALYAPAMSTAPREATSRFLAEVAAVVRRPRCLILAFAFFAYSCQIFSLTFALPLLLTSVYKISLGTAGLLSALVLAVSTIGHVSSGFLLRAGVPIWTSIAAAFLFFAFSAFAIYGGVLAAQGTLVIAALAMGIGGLAPGAIYAAAPHAAPGPSAVPPTTGLVQQASNLGQFAGPVTLGLWVDHLGWQAAPAIVAPVALFGLAAALVLRCILVADEQ